MRLPGQLGGRKGKDNPHLNDHIQRDVVETSPANILVVQEADVQFGQACRLWGQRGRFVDDGWCVIRGSENALDDFESEETGHTNLIAARKSWCTRIDKLYTDKNPDGEQETKATKKHKKKKRERLARATPTNVGSSSCAAASTPTNVGLGGDAGGESESDASCGPAPRNG